MDKQNSPVRNSRKSERPTSKGKIFYEVRWKLNGGKEKLQYFSIKCYGPCHMIVRFLSN